MKVVAAIDSGDIIYNQTSISYDFPHWKQKDSFLLAMSQEINESVIGRVVERENMSQEDRQYELDTVIDRSSQQISELTQEIKALTKKGFG